MKVAYYPGCSLEVTARAYDLSTHQVCRDLDVELEAVPEWICCGASPALKMSRLLSVSLSAQNLALVARQGIRDVVAPCPFCFRRLRSAQTDIENDSKLKAQVESVIETHIEANLHVYSLLEYVHAQVGLEAIRSRVARPLTGLKAVPYYGCYLVRPPKTVQFDDPEHPTSLDSVLEALGATVVDWDFKAECCGAALSLNKTDTVTRLSGQLIREAERLGADVIVVACPLCQANLDLRQPDVSELDGHEHHMPILYFTQAMGISFGHSPRSLGLHGHMIDPLPLLREKGIVQ